MTTRAVFYSPQEKLPKIGGSGRSALVIGISDCGPYVDVYYCRDRPGVGIIFCRLEDDGWTWKRPSHFSSWAYLSSAKVRKINKTLAAELAALEAERLSRGKYKGSWPLIYYGSFAVHVSPASDL